MYQITEIKDQEEKRRICEEILRTLPNWFGIEEAIIDYRNSVMDMPFIAVLDKNKFIGFIAIKIHNQYTAEVYVMGITEDYHRKGIGKLLINECESYCIDKGYEFLTVKTLDESRECESYSKTRLFYLSMGFKPLEVFSSLWGEDNPCLFMAKALNK
ncbi:GNAT family N-acetyltransferase [Alkaliphilus serpentinus]|uniref:GNAT family N-acetyltransferase n=1 Tax=Alkaliphilus serpentinus TaxID=1482731 RepID=A0A833M7B3_9FIRM|nr:GNAT family N-acetyltransferase [Alkaliphilus serpentinus]KAB3527278.1 GNAT family N-acetyltransferase [Alkaliphilus serpentinus]